MEVAFKTIVLLQIDHFIQAIEMNPAVVSLKGYANVNRELLTSVSLLHYFHHFDSNSLTA